MNRACAKAREILKPLGEKTNTAKRVLKVLTVPLAACALMFGATSASAAVSDHTVQTANPTGTTVNLFDYWVVDGDNDSSKNVNNDNKNDNTGINKDHQLKFNGGAGTGINKWTGRSDTGGFGRLSFVKDVLVDGYPAIKEGTYASLRMPSGEIRRVDVRCRATVGEVGNAEQANINWGKAGRMRWKGKRPTVRGVVMNPVDHPHGGGEGKTSGGRHPVSPWGKPEGRTRKPNKPSDKLIVRRRRTGKKR